jgi:hypothetical protein
MGGRNEQTPNFETGFAQELMISRFLKIDGYLA